MVKTEKAKALDAAIANLEKMGINAPRLSENARLSKMDIDVIPTGSIGLDYCIGVGGYPRGRMIELYGLESSGKSTIALIGMAQAQKAGGEAVLIDMEHSFNRSWAEKLGVDTKNLRVIQPDYGEQALEAAEQLARSGAVDMIVLDSTAALLPKAEFEGSMEDQQMGLQPRLMSKAMRKMVGAVGKSPAVVIFINQIRQKLGVMWGNPNTTSGGLALKFYSSIRLEVNAMSGKENTYYDDSKKTTGHRVRVKVTKNKVAPPFRDCEFDLYFDRGIDIASELPDLVIAKGVVTLEGKTYTFGKNKWVGMSALKTAVSTDPKLVEELKEQLVNVDKKAGT